MSQNVPNGDFEKAEKTVEALKPGEDYSHALPLLIPLKRSERERLLKRIAELADCSFAGCVRPDFKDILRQKEEADLDTAQAKKEKSSDKTATDTASIGGESDRAEKAVEALKNGGDYSHVLELLLPLKRAEREKRLERIAQLTGASLTRSVRPDFSDLLRQKEKETSESAAANAERDEFDVPRLADCVAEKDFLATCVLLTNENCFCELPYTLDDVRAAAHEAGLVPEFNRDSAAAAQVAACQTAFALAGNALGQAIQVSPRGNIIIMKGSKDEGRYPVLVSTPIIVEAQGTNLKNTNPYTRFKIRTRNKQWNTYDVPASSLVEGKDWQSDFQKQGLKIGDPKTLLGLLKVVEVQGHLWVLERTGWEGDNVFVLPNGDVLIPSAAVSTPTVIDFKPLQGYVPSGTLAEVNEQVFKYCQGNSRLVLATCAALTAPFLKLVGEQGGGFHFFGDSGIGKTVTARVAAAITGKADKPLNGGIIGTWRTTDNGMEAAAAQHSDGLMIKDELHLCKPNVAHQVIYMLEAGTGKEAMDRNRVAREPFKFRNLVISTGELTTKQHIEKDANLEYFDGAQSRMCDIPADAGREMGVFENVHGFEHPAQLAKHLECAAAEHYGHHLRAIVQHYLDNPDEFAQQLRDKKAEVHALLVQSQGVSPSDQEARAAHRFALCGAVGEIAISLGLLPWKSGAALDGVSCCFRDWLNKRGHGNLSAVHGIKSLERYLSANEDHFRDQDDDRPISNLKGYKRTHIVKTETDGRSILHRYRDYFMLDETLAEAVGQPQRLDAVIKYLKEGKHDRLSLVHDRGRNQTDSPVPSRKRCYAIRLQIDHQPPRSNMWLKERLRQRRRGQPGPSTPHREQPRPTMHS